MNKKLNKNKLDLNSAQRLKALMNALPVGITFSTDKTCNYITGNPYILHQLEMVKGDNISASSLDHNIAGTKLRHFINGKQITGAEMPMQRAIAENKQTEPLEIEVELPSGRHWVMEAIGAPVRDEKGKVIASVAVNVDLTERRRAEEANRLERLVGEEKQKLEFIADTTHELRTPLAIIKGNVDLALRAGIYNADTMKETLHAIDNEIIHLDKLLSDLTLLTTKGNDFQRKLGSNKIAIHELITHLSKRYEAFAKKKHVKICLAKIPKIDITGDKRYLDRLFSNIITNAILYSKKNGSVWISCKKQPKEVHIVIRDNGIGISKKDLPHIFERFYRAEKSRSDETGGTGLGLSIAKWITKAHGGNITVTSHEGKGSIFNIILPL